MFRGEAAGIVVFSACLGLGAFLGSYVGEGVNNDHKAQIEEINDDIANIEGGFLDADLEADRMEVRLGEGCLALMSDYGPDGRLEDTDESIIVDDLLHAPTTPCGTVPTEVRADTREYIETAFAIPNGQERIAQLETYRDAKQDDLDNALPEQLIGALVGGVIMLAPAVAGGVFAYDWFDY